MKSQIRNMLAALVGGLMLVLAAPTPVRADDDDWEDRWEDYEDALEDAREDEEEYWEDREDAWEDWRDDRRHWRRHAPQRYYGNRVYYGSPSYGYSYGPPTYHYYSHYPDRRHVHRYYGPRYYGRGYVNAGPVDVYYGRHGAVRVGPLYFDW